MLKDYFFNLIRFVGVFGCILWAHVSLGSLLPDRGHQYLTCRDSSSYGQTALPRVLTERDPGNTLSHFNSTPHTFSLPMHLWSKRIKRSRTSGNRRTSAYPLSYFVNEHGTEWRNAGWKAREPDF